MILVLVFIFCIGFGYCQSSALTLDATATITAFPNPITVGQSSTLSWTSTNTSSCIASGSWSGTKAGSGSESISPSSTSVYTITCSGAGDSFVDSVTVTVMTGSIFYISKSGNDSNPGTLASPWLTIGKANSTLTAGETVFVRGGTYLEQIRPANSGTSDNHITFAEYPGETAIITTQGTTNTYGVNLSNRNYVIIDGFTITDTSHNMVIIDSGNNNIIRNNYIHGNYEHVYFGIYLLNGSSYNKLQNNTVETTTTGPECAPNPEDKPADEGCIGIQDLIRIYNGGDHNLVEDNTLGKALHVAIAIGDDNELSYHVVRNNTTMNVWHSSLGLHRIVNSLIEGNTILDAGSDAANCPWIRNQNLSRNSHSGLQLWNVLTTGPLTKDNILRRNIWKNNGRVQFKSGLEARNRFYHNNVYENFLMRFSDNDSIGNSGAIVKNNIIRDNDEIDFITPVAVNDNSFINNNISGTIEEGSTPRSLNYLESNYPNEWKFNTTSPPLFVDPANNDFSLRNGSQLINAGEHLTTAVGSSSGTTMTVADASYFTDGFGIVKGDLIQTSTGKAARITGINYSTNQLTLSKSLTWNDGDGVSLVYMGAGPDVGAIETHEGIVLSSCP